MADIELVTVAPEDLESFMTTMRRFFGQGTEPGLRSAGESMAYGMLARLHGEDAGTCGIVDFHLTVPGGARVRMDGVTIVVVSPASRRRGVLTAMMQEMLSRARERGAVVMGLGATESVIYRRYGYGVATYSGAARIDTAHGAWREAPPATGRIRLVPVEEAVPLWMDVETRASYTGQVNRPLTSWQRVVEQAQGRQPGPILQVAIHEDERGVVDGFVSYTTENRWDDVLTDGVATASQLRALTRDAHVMLWDHLLRLDMMEHLVVERFWVDDPVQHLLADPRRLRHTPHDDLQVRIVDVVASLSARRYSREDTVVIEVRDDTCPDLEGRFRVEGGIEHAHAERTTADADVVMDGAALGAIYLGDTSVASLAAAGVVEERSAGAVRRASAMFAWQPRPHLTYMF